MKLYILVSERTVTGKKMNSDSSVRNKLPVMLCHDTIIDAFLLILLVLSTM